MNKKLFYLSVVYKLSNIQLNSEFVLILFRTRNENLSTTYQGPLKRW
jgi:hypothetical protein